MSTSEPGEVDSVFAGEQSFGRVDVRWFGANQRVAFEGVH